MPDPTRQSISATQAPALFNRSPWLTRWMLWHNFHDGVPLDKEGDARMSWGSKLEPLILDQARDELALEVTRDQTYVRRGRLGCTRDAIVIDPTLGPGALETKCVFDYRAWMADWGGGKAAPAHYEVQLQEQMFVGDGRVPFAWGVLAVWVAGEVHYLRRDPMPDLWSSIETEAAGFFASVERHEEPDPFGAAIELPLLLAAERAGAVDLSEGPEAEELAEQARLYEWATKQARQHSRAAEQIKVQLLAALGEAAEARLYGNIRLKTSRYTVPGAFRDAYTATRFKVSVPDELPDRLTDQLRSPI